MTRAMVEVAVAGLLSSAVGYWHAMPAALQLLVLATAPLMLLDLTVTSWYDRVVERDDKEFPVVLAALARVVLCSIWIVLGIIIDAAFHLPQLFTVAAFYWAIRQSAGWLIGQLVCISIVFKQDVPDMARLAAAWLCPRLAKKVRHRTLPRRERQTGAEGSV
jgi:hypothetical protein